MLYTINDFRYENEQSELAFENECASVAECIDMFISMLVDLIGEVDEHDQILIDKLQTGDYEVHDNAIIVKTYERA